MVRDGRAVSHSLVSRNLEFPPFSNHDHSRNLKQWAKLATGMDSLCGMVGEQQCTTVRYEDMVTETEKVLRQLTSWLNITWQHDMLRHHQLLHRVTTSDLETTADQIIKPVYKEAVNKWLGNIPTEVLQELSED